MTTNTTVANRLIHMIHLNHSRVCCGLDPDLKKIPIEITSCRIRTDQKVEKFMNEVVDLTIEKVCAYKIQRAFFDDLNYGKSTLTRIISYIHSKNPEMPVFLDGKIGDTENTMAKYLDNIFNSIGADGVTVNPYMGDDVFIHTQDFPEKLFIVLVKTSNSNASIVQDVKLENGMKFWEHILSLAVERWNKYSNIGVVLPSTSNIIWKSGFKKLPASIPILIAGYGVQGGSLKNVKTLLTKNKISFINSSRGILYQYKTNNLLWREKISYATEIMKCEINNMIQDAD